MEMYRRLFAPKWTRETVKWIALALILVSSPALGQSEEALLTVETDSPAESTNIPAENNRIRALRINPHAPTIDGLLNDVMWSKAEFVSGFTQKEPNEGEPAQDQTEVAFLYDDVALYVAARLRKTEPHDIVSTMSRRDKAGNSERIIISLDTYHDRRTAYSFAVTASGVRVDYYHASDSEGNRDYDFDPVWEARVQRTEYGWSAEMRIPFSQLRFQNRDVQTWGVNINRWTTNLNEDSYWVMIPKESNGWSSRMGELTGIEGIHPGKRVELLPYVSSDATFATVDPENPFRDGKDYAGRIGGDFKIGMGPNLTLDGTINPDFGQVEADPAVVNLSAFEIAFPERRPFFLEGRQIFETRVDYFYSRRIGAPPHGNPDASFLDMPVNTSILGAAKLTGRLNSGLSVGVLGALTQKEKAKLYDASDGSFDEAVVEPTAGYGVVRLQQEFGANSSTIGIIGTGMQRDVHSGNELAFLTTRAASGGLDWNLRWKGGRYVLSGYSGASYVSGTHEAIEDVQTSSARFYQRPDADYVNFDPSRTSLAGWTAGAEFEKNAGKHWLWEVSGQAKSPGFELNDIGLLRQADDITGRAGLEYRENEASGIFRKYDVELGTGTNYNFGLDRQWTYFDLETFAEWRNFWGTWLGAEFGPAGQSDNLTRGGPSMATYDWWNVGMDLWSGQSGKTTWAMWAGRWDDIGGGGGYWAGGRVTFRPGSRWELSLNPRYNIWTNSDQYIDTQGGGSALTYGDRYIFAWNDRSSLRIETRLNYAFTPNFTLELWAEPFVSSGRFYDFGELRAARTNDKRVYGEAPGTSINNEGDGVYTVNDRGETFQFEASDFNRVSFRSNVVLRWEWSPGSTLYFVWQQNRAGEEPTGGRVNLNSLGDAFGAEGTNFVALKITYWIPLF
ncbi:MAG: DUF5916 domain-containing protein [bacterium]|nr:DUF5916 domain-containing protein [bacterium]